MVKSSSISGYFSVYIDLVKEDGQTKYYIDDMEIDSNIIPHVVIDTLIKINKTHGDNTSLSFNVFGEFPYDSGVDELVMYGVPEIESIFSWGGQDDIDIDADELTEEFVAVLTDLAITYGEDDDFLTNMLED